MTTRVVRPAECITRCDFCEEQIPRGKWSYAVRVNHEGPPWDVALDACRDCYDKTLAVPVARSRRPA